MLTVDIIEDIVNSMKPLIRISSVDDISVNEWRVNTCNTYWLRACREIDIDGSKYIIGEVIHNESFTITPLDGAIKPVATSFEIYAPSFYFGTRRKTNTDRHADGNLNDDEGYDAITPFAFLLSRISETEPNDDESPILRNANIKIFFLEKFDLEDDTTNKNLLDVVLRQLQSMADYFLYYINSKEDSFNQPENVTRRQYEEFSDVEGNGFYLDDSLAGVELELTLPILSSYKCDSCQPVDPTPVCAPVIVDINNTTYATYATGTVNNIVVEDTDNNEVGFNDGGIWRVPSGGGVCDPVTVNINGGLFDTYPSGSDNDIEVRDTDNVLVGFDDSGIWRVPTANLSNIIHPNMPLTGQQTARENYDDGWRFQAGLYIKPDKIGKLQQLVNFYTLKYENEFGNFDRFTNTVGTQSNNGGDGELINVTIDHYYNKMLYIDTVGFSGGFTLAITTIDALTIGGFTNWYLPNDQEVQECIDKQSGAPNLINTLNTIFRTTVQTDDYMTSTTPDSALLTYWAYTQFGQNISVPKGTSSKYFAIRDRD